MKTLLIFMSLFSFILIEEISAITPPKGNNVLWYQQPATEWMTSALPLGNGRLGAMVFGGIDEEHIQINDKTLWEGDKKHRGAYQNFGDVYIYFDHSNDYTDYIRSLDIDNAIAKVNYKINGITYSREYFASNPDNAIVMRLNANRKGKVGFTIKLQDAHEGKTMIKENRISISGKLTLLSYSASLTVITDGGNLISNESSITVKDANTATIVFTGGTNFDPKSPNYLKKEKWESEINSNRDLAIEKSYDELKNRHLQDYHSLFDRVFFSVGNKKPMRPTDELLKKYSGGEYDAALDVLFFNYGRYLSIASSREGLDLPSNLQGIWNNSNEPAWGSDIHSNVNVQMNYWLTEVTNLAECHTPFINYIYNEAMTQESWKNMAEELNCKGWTMKTQNNIFGYSDWLWHRPANAWYSMHLWEKYLFNPDFEYLKTVAYPAMKSACEFWFNRLFIDDEGKLIVANEWSPENGPWENGTAYAQQLICDLFINTVKAGKILNIDLGFVQELEQKLSILDSGLNIGSWGQLREWKYTEDDPENKHRHISHLVALYPGKAISPIFTPKYADAAIKTLNARGDSGTGWSRVWKVAFWARLLDGNRAHKLLKSALDFTTDMSTDYMAKGGVYENLLDAHPPFQIDGNLGATACMTELLLQSHLEEIHLLPALPDVWRSGEIKGIIARGAFVIDMKWNNNKLTSAAINSRQGGLCKLRTNVPIKISKQNVQSQKDDKGYYITIFDTDPQKTYRIEIDSE